MADLYPSLKTNTSKDGRNNMEKGSTTTNAPANASPAPPTKPPNPPAPSPACAPNSTPKSAMPRKSK
ncbi:MAG: hypothetical protein Q9199_007581 [Rusavskia elegans]